MSAILVFVSYVKDGYLKSYITTFLVWHLADNTERGGSNHVAVGF